MRGKLPVESAAALELELGRAGFACLLCWRAWGVVGRAWDCVESGAREGERGGEAVLRLSG